MTALFKNPFFPNGDEYAKPYFSTSAFSGTLDCGIDIWLPSTQELIPNHSIKWNYGGMNIFGYGFSYVLPYFMRRTAFGLPKYDLTDALIHPDYGILTSAGSGNVVRYHPRVQSLFSRIEYLVESDVFKVTLCDGTVTLYSAKSLSPGGQGFIYYPDSSVDSYGNTIRYSYCEIGNISKIEYGNIVGGGYAFEIKFTYEERQDVSKNFNGGFERTQTLRCSLITVFTRFGENRKLREITFHYDDTSGYSLLHSVDEKAFSEEISETSPPITIRYTDGEQGSFSEFTADADIGSAIPISLGREGASGLLYQYPSVAYYSKPVYSEGPSFASRVMLKHLPAGFVQKPFDSHSMPYTGSFLDLDGDGSIQWVTPEGKGYHEYKNDKFDRFTPFLSICPMDRKTEFADIFGDGKLSAFTVMKSGKKICAKICRGLGRKGFGKPETVDLPTDFPAASFSKKQFTGFIRFFGDGLIHRVLINQKKFTVFPNLGGGEFGDGIDIVDPPEFISNFDVNRIRFADTTGSGTDDIIYIERHRIGIYRNIAGAFFNKPLFVNLPEPYSPSDSIYITNFSGEIVPQLIFIKNSLSSTRAYYLNFAHCFLICGISNGYGLEYKAEYTSSAKFLLADHAAECPWKATPPYHIPVISRFEKANTVALETNTSLYSYRDGRYIAIDRALYGFGTICEKYTADVTLPDGVPDDLLPNEKIITTELYIGDSETPLLNELTLVGLPITVENAYFDGTVLQKSSRKYEAMERDGSYFAAFVEEIMVVLGKEEPRISQTSYLYDEYGNIISQKSCFFPKTDTDNALDEQKTEYVLEILNEYININEENTYLVGVPLRVRRFVNQDEEAYGRNVTSHINHLEGYHNNESGNGELVSLREFYYADPATGNALPLGECKPPMLLHHSRDAVFSADHPDIIGLEAVLTDTCGYYYEDGFYYTSDMAYEYDADCFYHIVAKRKGDSLTRIFYDSYGIFVTKIEKTLSDTLSLTETYIPNYAALAYQSISDMNENTETYIYDAFGHLRGLSYTSVKTMPPIPRSLDEVIENPEKFMTEGMDMFLFISRNETPCKAVITKKGTESLKLEISFFDAYGRDYGQAVSDGNKWIISEKTIYADEMKILCYPPYFAQSLYERPTDVYPIAYAYDIFGRVVKVYTPYSEAPAWRAVESEYEPWATKTQDMRLSDSAPFVFTESLDPRGLSLTEVYAGDGSAAGEVLRSKRQRGGSGNITGLADGRLAAKGLYNIEYHYDMLARVVKTISTDSGTSLCLYGIDGQLVYEDSKGSVKTYSYDALGRFVALHALEGGNDTVIQRIIWGESLPDAVKNNLIGRVYQQINFEELVTYHEYDRFGNALAVERSYQCGGSVSANYQYNPAGELTNAVIGGFSLTFDYSLAGRVRAVSSASGVIFSNLQYTAEGYLSAEYGANGLMAIQEFDPFTRIVAAQSIQLGKVELHKAAYNFTAQGNLSDAVLETQGISPFRGSYNYDAHSRLTKSEETKGSDNICEYYVYDDSGNIVSFKRTQNSETIMTRTFEIDEKSNRVNAVTINDTRIEHTYDAYGAPDQLNNGSKLSYDKFGKLLSVESENHFEEYSYDVDGKRISRIVQGENSVLYFNENPNAGDYVRMSDGSEMLKLNFGGMLNAVLINKDETELLWQVTDHRNSVILTTDSSGNVLFHELFSPYGEPTASEVEGREIADKNTTNLLSAIYRFTGKEFDSGTGLYYFGARYYSAETGRMITPDDVDYASPNGLSGLNLYVYCLGNPETLIDSTGNCPHYIKIVGQLAKVSGYATTIGLGYVMGKEFIAITPIRAAIVSSFAAAGGEFISQSGGLYERGVAASFTAIRTFAVTLGCNYIKEAFFHCFPGMAENYPRLSATVFTVLNIGTIIAASNMINILPEFLQTKTMNQVIGQFGGNMISLVNSLFLMDDNYTSPKILNNRINGERVIEFGVNRNINNQRAHVFEFNRSEDVQRKGKLTSIMANVNNGVDHADVIVVIHGTYGGLLFMDGPQGPNKNPLHITISSEELAEYLIKRLDGQKPELLKLISCHGGEGISPFFPATAQTLANRLETRVAGYDCSLTIKESACFKAKMFYPEK